MKKFFLIISVFFLFFPLISLADGSYRVRDLTEACPSVFTVQYSGLVPCGRNLEVISVEDPAFPPRTWQNDGNCGGATAIKFIPCTMCHFFALMNGIINFIMLTIIPPIMVLIFTLGGFMFYFSGQNPQRAGLGKKILTSALIGFVIIYGSWMIINTVLTAVGVSEWTGLLDDPATAEEEGWFKIKCDIKIKF